jgi:DNA-binding CsgD family transcriptional regulator
MEHLLILFYAVTLMVGIWAAYYTSLIHKLYRLTYLKSFVHHILFLNLLVFLELSTKYFMLNVIQQLQQRNGKDIYVIARYGMGLIAAGGMGYTFAKISIGLLGRSMNRRLKMAFIFILIIFTFGYGAGIASYLQNDDLRLLDLMKSTINMTVLVVLLASIILLLVQRGMILEKGRRKVVTAFAFLYLLCVIAISVALLLDFTLERFLVAILLLLMNLFPILWCKGFFLKYYGEAPPIAFHGILLERIIDVYHISSREKEILELILQGRSNKEIKDLLCISVHTVRNHIYNLYQKLGVKSRGQLVHFIMEAQKKS